MNCRQTGDCDTSKKFAFDTLDLTGCVSGTTCGNNFNARQDDDYVASSIWCCQDGKDCTSGYEGCCPSQPQCCDVDSCSGDILSSAVSIPLCANLQCYLMRVSVSSLYNGGTSYSGVDWNNVLLVGNSTTCADLKAQRTVNISSSGSFCQIEDGKVDDDFTCHVSIFNLNSNLSQCPSACPGSIEE